MNAVPIAAQPNPSTAVAAFLKRKPRLLIAGEWVEASTGGTLDVIDPATGKRVSSIADAEQGRCRPRGCGRSRRLRAGPVAGHAAQAARGAAVEALRPDRRQRGGARRAREHRQRQDALHGEHHRRARHARLLPLHGGLGHEDRGSHLPELDFRRARPEIPHLHATRAGRRRGADRAVELPAGHGGLEARTGARRRLHLHPQARRADLAHFTAARRADRSRRVSRRAWSIS